MKEVLLKTVSSAVNGFRHGRERWARYATPNGETVEDRRGAGTLESCREGIDPRFTLLSAGRLLKPFRRRSQIVAGQKVTYRVAARSHRERDCIASFSIREHMIPPRCFPHETRHAVQAGLFNSQHFKSFLATAEAG